MHTTSNVHLLTASDGHRVGVARHPDGHRELVVHHPADPAPRRTGVLLTAAEAQVLADVAGADGPATHCARLDRHDDGVCVLQVLIGGGSPRVGRPLADAGVDGAVVAAVVRGERVLPPPGPDFRCRAGDIVVIIGGPDAVFDVIDAVTAA
ncbi:hypothetical protein Daura_27970 [Dactylosporangium aurantiacum]|uniref:RCK C-terminal domain-containing protein n=1 Tax=Dactylosporangium aurantiacum TaxID=35754 RepID=A0A9Q9I7P0_9ACTN|nr:TrkA C-terminal domain-containing protein [Dactylosporangium aurantiacum]MDG6106984.1 TrkA C-terminal domain-containing protein [Dactylosporangium aurantiacum]UWZ50656.1 hypothetical protein Daura_27970 [Dactylosporangium aurantiacum]